MTDTIATVTALRDALVARVTDDWDMDPWGEYEASRRRLEADLDAIIAAATGEADARIKGLQVALSDALVHIEHEHYGWAADTIRRAFVADCTDPGCLHYDHVGVWADPTSVQKS